MLIKVLKSKLHRATVTDSTLQYPGSVAIDQDFMDAAGLVPYEQVLIADLNNGQRLETYVIPAERGSRRVGILGAAARLVAAGDEVIVMAFGFCDPSEASSWEPKVVVFGPDNEIRSR